MMPEEEFALQREWSEGGLTLLRGMLPLMIPVAQHSPWAGNERLTIQMLIVATARSSESVLLLSAYGQLWDAEMVLRSVFEGTLKLAYILEKQVELSPRHEEFAEQLFEIGLLKDHQKAADLLAQVSEPSAPELRPFREKLLSDEERARIGGRLSKQQKRELERKWGFTGLLKALGDGSDPSLKELTRLACGYALMSHLQHVDYAGIALPFDRDSRAGEGRVAMHFAHLARLIMDTVCCMHLRLIVGYRFASLDEGPLVDVATKLEALGASFGGAYERWAKLVYPET